jgi:hypothetical protein
LINKPSYRKACLHIISMITKQPNHDKIARLE